MKEEYLPIDLIESNDDLSLFDYKKYKLALSNVKDGGARGENEIVMYCSDNYSKTNIWGYEAQINENFEVVSLNVNVDLLENGYIISGHSKGATTIKNNIKVGDFVIYIREKKIAFIFESKEEYKNAYYISKINYYLKSLNKRMITDNLYEDLYNELLELNNDYKKYIEANNENLIKIYSKLKGLYGRYVNIKEKIDFSKISYSNTIKLEQFEYKLIYTNESQTIPENLVCEMTVSHEGEHRKENELVKYDETNIISRNEYGYEAAINSNGNIIDMGITVELPENGYILSGHGTNRDLIRNELKIGDYITYKNMVARVYREINIITINNIGNQIQTLIQKYNQLINDKMPLYYDDIAKKINLLISFYNSIDINNIESDIKTYFEIKNFDYESLILQTKFLFLESNPVQVQAIWHSPDSLNGIYNESTKEGVQQFLKVCSECGFNRIYVQVNQPGIANYHSNILQSHNIYGKPYGEYKDYLECFIEEAHKLNIEVITWLHVFRVRSSEKDILASCYKEEWLTIDYYGNKATFLDSTNPEVHNFLISLFSEIAYNYNNDGLEYDYIRYESSNILSYPSTIKDFGYTENSINMFKNKYGYSSTEDIKTILKDQKARSKWVEFKKQRITDLLINSKEKLRAIKPNLILTAAVFSSPDSINIIMQDWPRWLNEELIDYVEPMIYQRDTQYFIKYSVPNFIDCVINKDEQYIKNKVIIGVGTVVSGGDYLNYLDQIQYVLSLYHSYTIFSASLTLRFTKLYETFMNYNYKPISYTSTFEDKIKVLTNDLIKKIEQYYSIISNQDDFSKLIESLDNFRREQTEDRVSKVFEEIDLIKDEKIKDNIYNVFIKINTK